MTTEILEEHRRDGENNGLTAGEELALAPLVEKIAHGLARGLAVAMKELENHIASETRKVSESVGRRLETLQASVQELTEAVSEQRKMNLSVQDKCRQLAEATAALQESDARQAGELATVQAGLQDLNRAASEQQSAGQALAERCRQLETTAASLQDDRTRQALDLAELRSQTTDFSKSVTERIDLLCKESGVQQEDIAAIKSTLCGFSTRVDGITERLDRQAEALRSMYSTYAQRESELEQLVDGLARLRAYPAPKSANGL